jgi:sulfur carrier protein
MKVNGKEVEFQKGLNLEEFLENNNYDITKVVVECNGEIIPKDSYQNHILDDKNTYEIVVFVAGG